MLLSGEILIRTPLSVALLPPPSLIELCKAMATLATLANQQNIDDDDIYLENGLLSYENPNYHMDPQRIESNSHLYEEILSELQQQNTIRTTGKSHIVSNRKDYARLDIGSMGVDLKEHFHSTPEKESILDAQSPSELKRKSDQVPEKQDPKSNADSNILSDENTHAKIKHVSGDLNADDLYALPNKRSAAAKTATSAIVTNDKNDSKVYEVASDEEDKDECDNKHASETIEDKDANNDLPFGWEKHEDNDGPYYWHIKSGTIQREPPLFPKEPVPQQAGDIKTPSSGLNQSPSLLHMQATSSVITKFSPYSQYHNSGMGFNVRTQETQSLSVTRSNTSSALDFDEERRRREDLVLKRRSYPLKSDSDRPIRFAVRSLGWVEIAEEDLTPERSSKAVNKCIVDLSLGRNDLLDVVGRWGDGKDLFMDLDEGALKLIDPENLTILNTQPIHTIRVWGVGRDNGRDFAYVARDRLTRIHMCHVFRCDTAARTIANTLRDICKRIMIERSLQIDSNSGSMHANESRCATRPTDLPTENRRWARHAQSFPTPMEEPKKVLKAQYLGSTEVNQPTGMDTLNAAIDVMVYGESKMEQWENVNVAVAPSMISINSSEDDRLIAECRVRYLSFLGIGKNVKNCAFIMHTAQDKFVCHVFMCEPSSGALCKTIEAACKLRYQKCLDAHPESRLSSDSTTPNKGIGATIKNLMNTLSLNKKDRTNS
ncbi:protein Fe65 homolog isoform X1 [Sitodiplosis mosellana]|uniref:protein Fe65 homolog isoform X1 n=1 Tax=Sitodiplosis mosellana TaxID=263140 RepID=UPI002443C941|nr:protein Fe65 homolog isoform X1 [Sitodiplosis mosellana]XP_055320907.1 protein Fe65 homolog isoform X1 [Sitodiplosis mosellana]XP_055320909.1 protein Fe65 homolog isoform X1 [Sitodiplosis mosellana]XP_055320910.1 protein Fe65 homolog isoform X1 [Sitodiplosis mosellana]